jgi:hypothetical protein
LGGAHQYSTTPPPTPVKSSIDPNQGPVEGRPTPNAQRSETARTHPRRSIVGCGGVQRPTPSGSRSISPFPGSRTPPESPPNPRWDRLGRARGAGSEVCDFGPVPGDISTTQGVTLPNAQRPPSTPNRNLSTTGGRDGLKLSGRPLQSGIPGADVFETDRGGSRPTPSSPLSGTSHHPRRWTRGRGGHGPHPGPTLPCPPAALRFLALRVHIIVAPIG